MAIVHADCWGNVAAYAARYGQGSKWVGVRSAPTHEDSVAAVGCLEACGALASPGGVVVPLVEYVHSRGLLFEHIALPKDGSDPHSATGAFRGHELPPVQLAHWRAANFAAVADAMQWAKLAPAPTVQDIWAPSNCVADAIVASDPDSLSPHAVAAAAAGGRKYLLFHPQDGLVNQMLSWRVAAVFARALDRVLLVPPVLRHLTTSEFVSSESLVDVEATFAGLGVIVANEDDVAAVTTQALRPMRVIVLVENGLTLDDVPYTLDWFKSLWPATANNSSTGAGDPFAATITAVPKLMVDVDHISALYGGCSDPVLAFANLFQWDAPAFVERSESLRRQLTAQIPTWKSELQEAAYSAISAVFAPNVAALGRVGVLPRLTCVHFRSGDFAAYCAERAKLKEDFFTMDRCYPSASLLASPMAVRQVGTGEGDEAVVYVATNDGFPDRVMQTFRNELRAAQSRARVMGASTLFPGQWNGEELSVLEMSLCELAGTFVGNEFSTMSKLIAARRAAAGLQSHFAGYEKLEFDRGLLAALSTWPAVGAVLAISAAVAGVLLSIAGHCRRCRSAAFGARNRPTSILWRSRKVE